MSDQVSTSPQQDAVPARLARLPVSIFATIMGLAGLTIATEKMEVHFQTTHVMSHVMMALVVGLFAVLSVLQIMRAIKYPRAMAAEWHHPVRISFFPAIPIGLLLISIAMVPHHLPVSLYLWMAGAALQFVLSFLVISTWINATHFEPHHVNPAWFIPAVGNVVVPIAGMVHGFAEISWFFFAFGMVFWMVLLTIVMNRLFFHHPLPEHMIPTLCILIAPPAVGFLAYVKLTGSIDAFAHIIYYVALTFTIIVAMQIGAFRRIPFALSWWAYSFPLTAITIASIVMAEHGNIAVLETLALTLYVVAAFVIAGLAARTLVGVVRGEI